MKKHVMAATLAAASIGGLAPVASQAALVSGFTGAFAPATWTTTTTGNLPAGDRGSATFTSTLLTLVGGDNPTVNPDLGVPACTGGVSGILGGCQITTSHGKVGASEAISFHWNYSTADITPAYDIFGVLIDGVVKVLSDPGGALTESGDLTVASTSSLAFFINCTDCTGGAATATISNFQALAVPEPGTIAMLGLGVAMFGLSRSKRRAASSPALAA